MELLRRTRVLALTGVLALFGVQACGDGEGTKAKTCSGAACKLEFPLRSH